MATLAEVRDHKQAIADLVTLALHDLEQFWRGLDLGGDSKRIAKAVRDFAPALSDAYATATTTVTADWYDALREDAAVSGGFTAATLFAPSADEIQNELGYVLAPLFNGTPPEVAPTETFDHLSALVETVVTTTDRQTVRSNMAADKAAPRYARYASANACAFCRMLATRGADYRSEKAATQVTVERAGSRRQIGEKYHNNCRCIAVPVWGSGTYQEPSYVADWRSAYLDATDKLGGASDTNAILAHMRQSLDISH